MKYFSTRGSGKLEDAISFEQAVLNGLASDGGLYIPTSIPQLTSTQLNELREVSGDFCQLAVTIFSMFIDRSELSELELQELVKKSYDTFSHPEVTPVVQLPTIDKSHQGKPLHLLELFHGPTYAFKDVALQFLGNLFEFFLKRKNKEVAQGGDRHRLTVVGATSGDTGGAAIYGLRNKEDVDVFILHPEGKVSPIQEAQMTMVTDANVHNVSIPGDFDDCQNVVKRLFGEVEFRKKYHLGAVNSINWARILAQIVYYFKAYFALESQLSSSLGEVVFSVPTGNFGDILAGHYARKMGLPIQRLIIATNRNDILHRVFTNNGNYGKIEGQGVVPSHSPAMDILVSSNFERLLWYLALEGDASQNATPSDASATLSDWMQKFSSSGRVQLPEPAFQLLQKWFYSSCVDDDRTVSVIRDFYHGKPKPYLLDPHTAVGVGAALDYQPKLGQCEIICLATAHPAKFQSAVELATMDPNITSEFSFDSIMSEGYLPVPFKLWMDATQPRRCHRLPNPDSQSVKDLIASVLNH